MPDNAKKVLVVDDDPDARDFFRTVMEDHGYVVTCAKDGNEALAQIKEGTPDLVTLDMSMPERSGVAVYRVLKDDPALAGVPVVIITGISDDFKQFISTRRQVPPPEGYLSKPVEAHELVELVERLLGQGAHQS